MIIGYSRKFGGAAVTLNPADKAAALTLSNGDLTATSTTDTWAGVRATGTIITNQKKHFSVHVDSIEYNLRVGICGASTNISTAVNNTGSFAVWGQSTGFLMRGADDTNASNDAFLAYAVGDQIDVEVDEALHLIWFCKNGGNWNNDAGADPAAGTGGFDLNVNGTFAQPYYPYILTDSAAATAAFISGGWGKAASSGFTAL